MNYQTKNTVRLAALAVALLMTFAMAGLSTAAQPTATRIAVENVQYEVGTFTHTENIVNSEFTDTIWTSFFGAWTFDNSIIGTEENTEIALDTDNGWIRFLKVDNDSIRDNAEIRLTVGFNAIENLENVQIFYAIRLIDNVGVSNVLVEPLLENTTGDNIDYQVALLMNAADGWHTYVNDLTAYIGDAGTYEIKFRVGILDNEDDDQRIEFAFDNIRLRTKFSGGSDNIHVNPISFDYTENSLTSAGTLNLPVEENFQVIADNTVLIDMTFNAVWNVFGDSDGIITNATVVNGTPTSFTEAANDDVSFSFEAEIGREENIEIQYYVPILVDNVETVQVDSNHTIGTDTYVTYRTGADFSLPFEAENLIVKVSLEDYATFYDNSDNAKVAGVYTSTRAYDGENITFRMESVKTDNSFTIVYRQLPASIALVNSVRANNHRDASWTLTNPTASHEIENAKVTLHMPDLPDRVTGTEVVTWAGSALTSAQYTISGGDISIDPDLAAGTSTLTIAYDLNPIFSGVPFVGGASVPTTFRLVVKVVDEMGSPVVGASVTLTTGATTKQAVTNTYGMAPFDIESGNYTIRAEAEGLGANTMSRSLSSDQTVTMVLSGTTAAQGETGQEWWQSSELAIVIGVIVVIGAAIVLSRRRK